MVKLFSNFLPHMPSNLINIKEKSNFLLSSLSRKLHSFSIFYALLKKLFLNPFVTVISFYNFLARYTKKHKKKICSIIIFSTPGKFSFSSFLGFSFLQGKRTEKFFHRKCLQEIWKTAGCLAGLKFWEIQSRKADIAFDGGRWSEICFLVISKNFPMAKMVWCDG